MRSVLACLLGLLLIAATPPIVEHEELTVYTPIDKRLHLIGRFDAMAQQPTYTQLRPSIVYRWRALELAIGVAWVNHFQQQAANSRAYTETRPFFRARLTQSADYGSHYEQLTTLVRLYTNGSGQYQRIPRVAFRYGQNYWSGTRPLGERVQRYMLYEEIAAKFTTGSALDYERLWAMYEFPLGSARFAVGMRAQWSYRNSGEPRDLIYGPQVLITIGGG